MLLGNLKSSTLEFIVPLHEQVEVASLRKPLEVYSEEQVFGMAAISWYEIVT